MNCSKCGTQNPDDAKFCKECGSRLDATPQDTVDAPAHGASYRSDSRDNASSPTEAYDSPGSTQRTTVTVGPNKPKGSFLKKAITFLIVLAVVALVGLFLIFDPIKVLPWHRGSATSEVETEAANTDAVELVEEPAAEEEELEEEEPSLSQSKTSFGRDDADDGEEDDERLALDEDEPASDKDSETNSGAGTSQSSALLVPLNTKVFYEYTTGYAWLKFTTTDDEDSIYRITSVNETVGSDDLVGYLYDEFGAAIDPTERTTWLGGNNDRAITARAGGKADTSNFEDLEPETTYYLRLECGSAVDYSLLVTTSVAGDDAHKTSSSVSDAVASVKPGDRFEAGTNQNHNPRLALNETYDGEYEDGYAWLSFRTTDNEDAQYAITSENLLTDSDNLIGYLYDEFGALIEPTDRTTWLGGNNDRAVSAGPSGKADTSIFEDLEPETTYYLRLECGNEVDYRLTIREVVEDKEPENVVAQAEVEKSEPELVFEVPLELNETQVHFKAESAEFIDPAAVEATLKPVAEVILAHPDRKVLLAGTTATDGDQAARVKLSEARAGAVKSMLTSKFKVPESQLKTKGLGYKADPFVRGQDIDANGNWVETEAVKNRRVVLLDVEDPVAKQILGTK